MNRDRLVNKAVTERKESRPIIGITFLDRNNFGLNELYRIYRGDKSCLDHLNDFLEKARQYKTISELISKHASHIKYKNADERSKEKIRQIKKEYDVDAEEIVHLHCDRGGTGVFVLHGFFLGNCFEIVWLDAKHDLH